MSHGNLDTQFFSLVCDSGWQAIIFVLKKKKSGVISEGTRSTCVNSIMSQASGSHASLPTVVPSVNHIGKLQVFYADSTDENIDMKAMAGALASYLHDSNCCHTLALPFSSICCHLSLAGFPVSLAILVLQYNSAFSALP